MMTDLTVKDLSEPFFPHLDFTPDEPEVIWRELIMVSNSLSSIALYEIIYGTLLELKVTISIPIGALLELPFRNTISQALLPEITLWKFVLTVCNPIYEFSSPPQTWLK